MRVTNYFDYFMKFVTDDMSAAAEIDEFKFVKRKCQRGKRCGDDSWIFQR